MELDLQRFYNINRRIVMWIVFFTILWLLRDFFSLVFLTFIFGFIMRKVAVFLTANTRSPYRAVVAGSYLVAVALLILLMTTAVPRVADEGAKFSRRVPDLFDGLAKEITKAANRYGFEPALARYVSSTKTSSDSSVTATSEPVTVMPHVAEIVDVELLADKLQGSLLAFIPQHADDGGPRSLRDVVAKFIFGVLGATLNFLLAILLSFLVVLDYDRITGEMARWRVSQVGRFFHEAAASVVEFSGVVGTGFQCQMAVALLNASITCVGMFLLGIQPLLLLTTIVFLLGLIPVLGVFISSVPIILIAFNDYNLNRALLTLGMIVIVHLLEAYVFNPRIYAARFHLNPVIVLIILLVGEKLFGIWGMLLGIPVIHYVLNIAQVPSIPRRVRGNPSAKPIPNAS